MNTNHFFAGLRGWGIRSGAFSMLLVLLANTSSLTPVRPICLLLVFMSLPDDAAILASYSAILSSKVVATVCPSTVSLNF